MYSRTGKYKRGFLAILSILLLLSMTSCSSKGQENGQGKEDNGGSLEGGILPNAEIEKNVASQYVYTGEIIHFTEYGDRVNLHDLTSKGDQVFALIEVLNWNEEDESTANITDPLPSEHFYQVFSCLMDGSQSEVSAEIIPEENDGFLLEIRLSDTGCVAALCSQNNGRGMRLLFWDAFNDIYWEKETDAPMGSLFLQGDEVTVLCENNGRYYVNSYDKNGESGESVEMDGEIFKDSQAVYLQQDGCFLVMKTNMEGVTYAQIYDPVSGLTERKNLPNVFGRYRIYQGTASDFLMIDTVGVYSYNMGENAIVPLITYIDAYLDIMTFWLARQIDETHIAGIFSDGLMGDALGLFSREEAPEDLKVIVLGAFHEYDIPQDRILDFNRENNGYRITVKQYMDVSDELDAYTQFNMDILAGNMPDILAIDPDLPLQNLISKGLLADVGELISKDQELADVEFMDNFFDALRVDGVLYHVVLSVKVNTLVAKKSIVGDRIGWNAEEFSKVLESLPEGMEVVSEMSRYDYLAGFMDFCAGEIIDYDLGVCHFDSPEFKAALEFAATLPETAEAYGDGEYEVRPQSFSYDSRYIENKVLLQPVTISKVWDLCNWINGALGEDGAYVGFPSDSREGGWLQINGTCFVLSSQSDHLEEAWELVRYILTEDYQTWNLGRSGLPTRKDVFEAGVQYAAGYEGLCWVNDEKLHPPALTSEQLDMAVEFIEGVHHQKFNDKIIMNIIYEEADSYFKGQKNVEKVMEVIQNRVRLYLQERL